MTQVIETKMTAMADKMSGLLSALKAGVDACGGTGTLFASLLAETKTALPEVEAYEPSASGSYDTDEQSSRRFASSVSCDKEDRAQLQAQERPSAQQSLRKETSDSKEALPTAPRQDAESVTQDDTASQNGAVAVELQRDDGSKRASDDQEEKTDSLERIEELMALLAVIAPLDGKAAQVAADDAPFALSDGQKATNPTTMDENLTEAQRGALAALAQIQKDISADSALGEEGGEAASTQEGMNAALKEIVSNILVFKEQQKGGKAPVADEGGAEALAVDWDALAETGKELSQSGAKATTSMQGASLDNGGDLYAVGSLLKSETLPTAVTSSSGMATAALAAAAKETGEAVTGGTLKAASGAGQVDTTSPLGGGVKSVGSYDFASQLSAARVSKGGAAGLPQAAEQVAVQVHRAVKEGLDEITIQLKPAELGKIEVKLTVASDKSVTGTVVADNQATLTLLQKDSSSLQRALQDAGLQAQAGCMEFSLRDQGSAGQFSQNKSEGFTKGRGADEESYGASLEVATSQVETYYVTPGHVNLRV